MSKKAKLLSLARKRQVARWPGYACIGDFHDGAYECDHVSPFTKSASNTESPVMVLAQDWSSVDRLSSALDTEVRDLGHSPGLATNRNLKRLLATHFDLDFGDVFATNIFPFVKHGGLSSKIPQRDIARAACEYAIPQIEIVDPSIVVCLGAQVFDALRQAGGRKPIRGMSARIGSPFPIAGSTVWCQAHTGALGTKNRNRGGIDRVDADWATMAVEFQTPVTART